MRFCHQEAVGTNLSRFSFADTAVDDYLLSYDGVVADMAVSLFAFPAKVLRVGSDNGTVEHLYVVSQP